MTTGSIPKVFRVKLVVIMASVATLILCGCFTIVMNRKFAGEGEFAQLYGDWTVGAPRAVAFTSLSDRSYWDNQVFRIWIPLALTSEMSELEEDTEIRSAVRDSTIQIDSVYIVLQTLEDTLARSISTTSDTAKDAGGVVVSMYQGLFEGRDYTCLLTDTVTIPAEEDSISVSFTVHFRDSVGQPALEKRLSYKLWRQEGKKLYLDVGR